MKERVKRKDTNLTRDSLRRHYENKYFALWMSKFEWSGIDAEQERYIMTKFWTEGRIACFKLDGSVGSDQHPQGLLVFCPFAPTLFNIYDQPTAVTLINVRGAPFIPSTLQKVNKDVVLGYASKQRNGILTLIQPLIDKIVDAEMVIRVNLQVHKCPWLIPVSDFDKDSVASFMRKLDNDETGIFLDVNEPNLAKALISGAPYIIDKLYQYKTAIENEIRELLGFNNIGVMEKKEHLITGEIEANEEVLDQSDLSYYLSLKDFVDSVHDVLGVSEFGVRLRETATDEPKPEEEPKEEDFPDE